jgi:hypothetical protein
MDMNTKSDKIEVGCQVEVELVDNAGKKERLTIVIVSDRAADYTHGYLSENTPLAKALLGEKVGTIIPYLKDDILSIQVMSVTRSTNLPDESAAEKREISMQKTIRQVEDTSAMLFASSFSGKWGDYDPDSIPKEPKPDQEDDQSTD